MPRFALATLSPLLLLLLAGLGAGWAGWAALILVTAVVALLDRLAARVPDAAEGAEFPGSDALLVAVAGGLLLALALGARAAGGAALGPWDRAALFVALGLYAGQVGHAAAHELIHRPARGLRRLGAATYAALLFGHHAVAHPLVHHVHVATPRDPVTARLGEGFWAYAPRAWRGAWRAGLSAERDRRARAGGRHPYLALHLTTAAALALAWALGGGAGLLWQLGIGLHAAIQILLSDYVQHYGLARRPRGEGRWEPVGPAHAWDSPHPASSALLLNGARHADHHAHPARPFPALRLPGAPTLPRGLPAMAALALLPPLWRCVMDPRARRAAARAAPVAGP